MGIVYLVILLVAVPVFLFLLTWAVVTACRLLAPERPQPFERDPVAVRQQAAARGEHVPVGVREIREDQRLVYGEHARARYHYAGGASAGLPPIWMEDLWRRRN